MCFWNSSLHVYFLLVILTNDKVLSKPVQNWDIIQILGQEMFNCHIKEQFVRISRFEKKCLCKIFDKYQIWCEPHKWICDSLPAVPQEILKITIFHEFHQNKDR